MFHRALLFAATLSAPSLVPAQAPPLVGEWTLQLIVGMTRDGATQTPITSSARLVVTQAGDSLIAVLTVPPPEGMPAKPPARMAALARGDTAVFVQTHEAILRNPDGELRRTATSTYRLIASGDALSGSVTRSIEGIDMPVVPQPLTGTRVKS